ncbi:MAG: Mut7-C RNAse domain-containing protein [Methanomicrobiales archaeon]|nr:Mut7-C RNAse domain-containing protein [Methanomicrobiales archaeon]
MSRERIEAEARFVTDRMLGTLTRYLRFMGYDTKSANALAEGNEKEDTLLLDISRRENRILLTRDRELARRGGDRAIWIASEDVLQQVRQLVEGGFVRPEIRMSRCSLCNSLLRPARRHEIAGAAYAPRDNPNLIFFWCPPCRKLYWMGSHGEELGRRFGEIRGEDGA